MSPIQIILADEAIRERVEGIKEIIHNHYRWLRYHTGVETDPAGIVERDDAYADLTTDECRELSARIDRMENLMVV